MNADQINFCLEQRRAVADGIRADLGKYKVCTCCRSIAHLEVPVGKADVCTVCSAYQWDESVEAVLLASIQAGESWMPALCGTVPRGIVFPQLPTPTAPTISL
jgi:hypothetical protein